MPFIEYIDSDALKDVDLSNVKLLYDHDFGNILARTDSNTLTLKVDDSGLFFTANLPDTTLGNDTFTNIQNGNLKGCSFGFSIGDEDWTMQNGVAVHTIHKIDSISEISIVSLPAYEETSIEIQRSLNKLKGGQNMTDEEKKVLKQADKIRAKQAENDKDDKTDSSNNSAATDNSQTTSTNTSGSNDTDAKADDEVENAKEDVSKAEDNKNATEDDKDTKKKRANSTSDKETKRSIETLTQEVRSLKTNLKTKEVNKNMSIPVGEQKKDKEKRSLEDYIRSHGEKRDGVTTGDVGVLVPKEIIYDPSMEVNSVVDLSKLVQTTQVSTASGTYPILKRATDRMHTVPELEENPALAKPQLTNVDWKIDTYRAAMPVSEESIADTQTNLMSIIQQNAQEQRVNTLNYSIGQKLQGFTAQSVDPSKNPVDDIKQLINVSLDPAYNKSIIMTQSAYQIIDTLKDGEGRYLLQGDITQQGGSRLLGLPVTVIGDDLFGVAGDAKMWIGDLKRAILFAERLDTQIVWNKSEIYGRYLALVMRFDVEVADKNAGYFVTFGKAASGNGK